MPAGRARHHPSSSVELMSAKHRFGVNSCFTCPAEAEELGSVWRCSVPQVVTTITEYFWKFESTYTLEAFRGVGAEDADRTAPS